MIHAAHAVINIPPVVAAEGVDGATEDGNIETTLQAAVAITMKTAVPLPRQNPSIPDFLHAAI